MTDEEGDHGSAVEETADSAADPSGQPPAVEGVGSDPVRPGERPVYETEPAGGEESVTAAPSSPPGVAIGMLLLIVFVAILVWAVIAGLR